MIRKIIYAGIFLCLLIAIPLSLMGIEKVEPGMPFLAFLKNCNRELNDFKIEIPNIPAIPLLDTEGNPFLNFVNGVINFLNGVSNLINFIITLLNVVIQVIQFIFIVVKNLIIFKDTLIPPETSEPIQEGALVPAFY